MQNSHKNVVSPARLAAFKILLRVEETEAFSSILLAEVENTLAERDAALCHELVLGVLRWQLWIDRLIAKLSDRPATELDLPVQLALRLGLYQLRFLTRVPVSAAVNESVNLVQHARKRSASGFVNAVLRSATIQPNLDPAEGLSDPLERISIETSHPVWMIRRWVEAFGKEEAHAFARANNLPAPVAFRIGSAFAAGPILEELRKAGGTLEASVLVEDAWRVTGATKLIRTLAAKGRIYIQDEASQLVSHLLQPKRGELILDACAAPGSKTAHIADIVRGQAIIVAGDVHTHRLRVLRNNLGRLDIGGVRLAAYDATRSLPFKEEVFDRVLVDAPCTGTGTLRRNPEIRWRITASDMMDLSGKQLSILENTARMVKPGGRLVYSTCSVEPEENEGVVKAFIAGNPNFRQVGVGHSGKGFVRTWPHSEGSDGFFVAAFERRS